MSFKAVLFDMDGVLVRTYEPWLSVLAEAGQRFRGRPVTREEFDPTFGQGTAADVKVFGLGCSTEELDRFYAQAFVAHLDQVWVEPDAADLLDRLRQRGLRLAVVTNTVQGLARDVLRAAGLLHRFDFIGTADQVTHAKPAPDLVQHVLEVLDLTAAEAIYVGDSRFDRRAAQAAGVAFVGLGLDAPLRIERLVELEAIVLGA